MDNNYFKIRISISIETLKEINLLEKALKIICMEQYLANKDIFNDSNMIEFTLKEAKEIGIIDKILCLM